MNDNLERGQISIDSENMMPIIKKWLYSDKDIFIRELIANGCDAITKYNRLVMLGEVEDDDFKPKVTVKIDREKQTLVFCDNGIGMNDEQVRKYINNVAFSGAKDFIEKYEKGNSDSIIGHFGLGFYSAFMVSKMVSIESLSYLKGSEAVLWKSDGGTEYTIEKGEKTERGTEITLYLSDDEKEFLSAYKLKEIIKRYCGFLPYEIYVEEKGKEPETVEVDGEKLEKKPEPINDIAPLWNKNPNDCTDEEYKEFYHNVFNAYDDPIFWVHLNVDYPFRLKGILYFPHFNSELDSIEGQIKLYNNQVFVADNVKEVIPEFLLLLKGVIDCPDLPLNVSRSFLQNDGTVRKLQAYITKKVAEKLKSIFNNQREDYDRYWPDINPFIKFGILKDNSFYGMVKDIIIFEKLDGTMWTLEEMENYAKENDGKVYYVSDKATQSFYIDLFKEQNQQAIIMNTPVDNHFITYLENKLPEIKFGRIDSDIAESIKSDGEQTIDKEKLQELFKEATGKKELNVEVSALKSSDLPAIFVVDEQMRRMYEMTMRFANSNTPSPFEVPDKLILNSNNKTVQKLLDYTDKGKQELIAAHIYDIALMTRGLLKAEDVKGIIERSQKILELID